MPNIRASFLSEDAKTLAYFADKLYWVDTSNGKIDREIEIGVCDNILLTKDLRLVAAVNHQEGSISIRSGVDGTEVQKIETKAKFARPYRFSNDGSLLLVRLSKINDARQESQSLAIYDTVTGTQAYHVEQEGLCAIECASFSPDSTKLAIGQTNSQILLLDLDHFRVAPR